MQRPIVYVHGFIGHMNNPELRKGLDLSRVLAPDMLGYGRHADAPSSRVTVSGQVTHLREAIERVFGFEPVVLVGHSAGAALCVRYAQAYPGGVAALVSAEGNLMPSDAFLSSRLAPMTLDNVTLWLKRVRENPGAFLAQDHVEPTQANVRQAHEWLHHQSAPVIQAMARSLLVETVHPDYAKAVFAVMEAVPTYLISGARSVQALVAPTTVTSRAAGQRIIAGTGHMMILEAPMAFAAAVLEIESKFRNSPLPAGV